MKYQILLNINLNLVLSQVFNPKSIKTFKNNDTNTSFGFSISLLENPANLLPNQITETKSSIFAIVGAPRDNQIEITDSEVWLGNTWAGGYHFCYLQTQKSQKENKNNNNNNEALDYKFQCSKQKQPQDGNLQTNFPQYGDLLRVRFKGMTIDYYPSSKSKNSNTDYLVNCAPASQMGNRDPYENTGFCEIHQAPNRTGLTGNSGTNNDNSGYRYDRAFLKYDTYFQQNEQTHKLFGFSSSLLESPKNSRNKKDKIIFSAPVAWNEKGYITSWSPKSNGIRDSLLNPIEGQLQAFKDTHAERERYRRKGTDMSLFRCPNQPSSVYHAALSTSYPEGTILFLKMINDKMDQKNWQEIRSPDFDKEKATGLFDKFGFSITLVNLNGQPFILASAPFGVYGKLYLINACNKKFENDRLVDIPSKIKSFGYAVENIGNYDKIEGDEVIVGSPRDDNNVKKGSQDYFDDEEPVIGSFSILATRTDDFGRQYLKFIQTIRVNKSDEIVYDQSNKKKKSKNIQHLGLAISKFTKNLDNFAGDDIFVSGHSSVAAVHSQPFYSLVDNAVLSFKNQDDDRFVSKTSVKIFENDQKKSEVIRICLKLVSNLNERNQKIKTTALLTLDALRNSDEYKRYSFLDGTTKKLLNLYPDNQSKNSDGKNQQLTTVCTENLQIKPVTGYWQCAKGATSFISVSTDIQFRFTNLRRVIENSPNSEFSFLDNGRDTFASLRPVYPCSGPKSCFEKLTISCSDIGGASKTRLIEPSTEKMKRALNLKIKNSQNADIYGIVLNIKFSSNIMKIENAIDPVNEPCYRINNNELGSGYVYNCYLACPIKAFSVLDKKFNIIFDQVLGETDNYQLEYSLKKDGAVIPTSLTTITYEVKTIIKSEISPRYRQPRKIDLKPSDLSKIPNRLQFEIEFNLENNNQVISYNSDLEVEIKVPVQLIDKANSVPLNILPLTKINKDRTMVFDYGFYDQTNEEKYDCQVVKKVNDANEITNGMNDKKSIGQNYVDSTEFFIGYETVSCKLRGILPERSIKMIFRSQILTETFKMIGNPHMRYQLTIYFKVNTISGLSYSNVPSISDPGKYNSNAEQAFEILGLGNTIFGLTYNQFWTVAGISIGVLIILAIIAFLYFTNFFNKDNQIFLKTGDDSVLSQNEPIDPSLIPLEEQKKMLQLDGRNDEFQYRAPYGS